MKRFVTFITKTSDYFAAHSWSRILFYSFVLLALIAMFALVEQTEVAFVYNAF